MAKAQSNVFWVSYAPAEQESFRDCLDLLDKVASGDSRKSLKKHGVFAGEVVREGRRCVDAVVCSSVRMPVSAVVSATKWERKGAKGSLADAKWPTSGERPQVFLEKWANAMRAASLKRFAGSEIELNRLLEEYRHRERNRMRSLRGRKGRRRPGRGREPSPLPPCAPPTSPESEVSATVVDSAVASSDGPVNMFTGIDFTLPVEGLYIMVVFEWFETNAVSIEDEVLPSTVPFNAGMALMDFGLSADVDCALDGQCDLWCDWGQATRVNTEFMPQFGADISCSLGDALNVVDIPWPEPFM